MGRIELNPRNIFLANLYTWEIKIQFYNWECESCRYLPENQSVLNKMLLLNMIILKTWQVKHYPTDISGIAIKIQKSQINVP